MTGLPACIVLIGPMGAGKTAVGRRLARLLDYRFADSDAVIEERTGVDIPFIFEKEGDAGFRRRERAVIDELTREDRLVLATGGGAVTEAANRRCLAARAHVVYLTASVDQQVERTSRSRNRPLLQIEDPRARLETLMRDREPFYLELADDVVATDGRRVVHVARDIARHLARLTDEDA